MRPRPVGFLTRTPSTRGRAASIERAWCRAGTGNYYQTAQVQAALGKEKGPRAFRGPIATVCRLHSAYAY